MTTGITELLTRLDTPQFKVMGSYAVRNYDGQWCIIWKPNPSPWYSPPAIIAHCASETQAKTMKRALQNSLNHQARKQQ